MKRQTNSQISSSGAYALAHYEQTLREREDLTSASVRNYLSDVRRFIAWCEAHEAEHTADTHIGHGFGPQYIATTMLTRYRTFLQADEQQKPASVNRALMSLKRSFGWASGHQLITYTTATAARLVRQEESPPRHLDDQEDQALVATVTKTGILRDRVFSVLLLHTGLRAREVCHLQRDQVKLGKRSGSFQTSGKRNTYRDVPLNATARKVLEEHLPTHSPNGEFFFPSGTSVHALSEHTRGYSMKKYARAAKLDDVSPHDLQQAVETIVWT